MSIYNKPQNKVIDEDLLIECIRNLQISQSNNDNLISNNDAGLENEDINLVEIAPKITELYLSFKKINKIENLVAFDTIQKLYLDNNCISYIGNLSHLTTIQWLDLSFNEIKKIEGLDCLVNLEDLSLFRNKISIVEGLDNCTKLKCLSLGNNEIKSLDQIYELRRLKSLRVLTLAGNDVCKLQEYRTIVLAYIDTLKYLDYGLIYNDERVKALDHHQDVLLDVVEKESIVINEKAAEKAAADRLQLLDDAGVLYTHTLFDDIISNDKDIDLERLKHLPGVKDVIEQYRKDYLKLSDEFVKISLGQYEKKLQEIQQFEQVVKNIRLRDDGESTLLINNFLSSKKLSVAEITDDLSYSDKKTIIEKLEYELDRVCDELLNIEVHQSEKFESILYEFDNRLREMKASTLEAQQAFFRSIEELEKKYYEGVKGVAVDLIERQSNNILTADFLDDDALTLIIDAEACMLVIQSSYETHLGRIMKREDEARNGENKRYTTLVDKYTNDERKRNRDRILEIHEFSTTNRSRILAYRNDDDDDGEYEDEIIAPLKK